MSKHLPHIPFTKLKQ